MFLDSRRSFLAVFLAFLLIFALGTSSASFAQSTVPPKQAQAFVLAAIAVQQVNEKWQPRINQATSEAQAERLKQRAAVEARQVIAEVDGITVDQYRVLYDAAKSNQELAAYLSDLLEQEMATASQ